MSQVADGIGTRHITDDKNDDEREYSDDGGELLTDGVVASRQKGKGKGSAGRTSTKPPTPARTHSKWMTMLRNIKSAHQKLEKSSNR